VRTEINRYKDDSLFISPTTKKLHDSLEKASIKSQQLYTTKSLRETRKNIIQSIDHILNHDLVQEDPLAVRFVSEMERKMQNILKKGSIPKFCLFLVQELVNIRSYVFHPSTIRRERLLIKDSRATLDSSF
jgi:hypothetical protein